jgi:hypothetical protein
MVPKEEPDTKTNWSTDCRPQDQLQLPRGRRQDREADYSSRPNTEDEYSYISSHAWCTKHMYELEMPTEIQGVNVRVKKTCSLIWRKKRTLQMNILQYICSTLYMCSISAVYICRDVLSITDWPTKLVLTSSVNKIHYTASKLSSGWQTIDTLQSWIVRFT